MFSEVPGLGFSAKLKKRKFKQADHSSTMPPAYERIKAQLERRKKRQEVVRAQAARQPEAGNDTGNDKRRELVVYQESGGGKNGGEGSGGGADTRQKDRDYEKNTSVKRALKKLRKRLGMEVVEDRQREEEELDEADRDLQWAIDNYFNQSGWEEEEEKGNERSQVGEDMAVMYASEKPEVERRENSRHSQDHSGSQVGGSTQRMKVSSQRPVQEERVVTSQQSQAHPGSQAGGSGSAERMKVSSQRQKHQERLEALASRKRKDHESENSVTESESEDEDGDKAGDGDGDEVAPLDGASSVTESESEEDVPMPPAQQLLGKKRVSQSFAFTFSINFFFSALLILRFKTIMILLTLIFHWGKNE